MSRGVSRFAGAAFVLVAIALSGCARPVGDFGRAEDDPLHDAVARTANALRSLDQPLSAFNLSDEEREMRDRIWRYLVAPEAYDWFGDSVVELSREGFRVKALKPPAHERYYVWLHDQAYASSAVRYSHLTGDVNADIATMPATFASICAVETVDSQRRTAEAGISNLEPAMKAGVATRQVENETMIGWFTTAVDARYQAYSYALDHLLVETPHPNAIDTDTALSQLAGFVDRAKQGDFCDAGGHSAGIRLGPTLPSRYRPGSPQGGVGS